ncbi:hypothetical protein [Kribbella sp. NPDC049227]|uniref:hypothetical protein n=1 Tax=Kribbella sp. NPDC049227 TaxID=3364113 RepID=UPI00371D43B9
MSFIVPGQGKRNEEVGRSEAGAPPFVPGATDLPAFEEPPEVAVAGWPEELQQVVQDDFRRTSALASYRWKTADTALQDVVRGLDDLLDLVAERIEAGEPKRSRRQTKKATQGTAAAALLAELPFADVADLLGIPADEIDDILVLATRRSRADRRTALRAIKQLRAQLQHIEITKDHSRLSRLFSFIVRLFLVLGTAVGSQSVSELVAGDPQLDAMIQTGVGALVAFALERSTAALRDAWHEREPATVAAEAHKGVLKALADAAPADDNERMVWAFRILVCSARAWVACFQLEWTFTDKLEYWQVLDEIPEAIRTDSADTLRTLHQRLEALTPPKP